MTPTGKPPKKPKKDSLQRDTQQQVNALRDEATKLSDAGEHGVAAAVSRAAAAYESGLDTQARREVRAATKMAEDSGRQGTVDRLTRIARASADDEEPRL
jgi:hypothetical protein